mmetsp:Transcript_18566/g.37536  ORF Transcript_18566/g.37536 Transcript_18566/m.37536 type:complete len:217 (+) Transcript_18566:134-784(+)
MFKRLIFPVALLSATVRSSCLAFVPIVRRLDSSVYVASTDTAESRFLSSEEGVAKNRSLVPSDVLKRIFQTDDRPVILFDGVCNLCNSAVNLALDWDPSGKLRFAALQSNVGKSLLQAHGRGADDISSIVFVTTRGAYTKSDAILGITAELNPIPFLPMKSVATLGQIVVPRILRDAVYDGVANNRYSIMGKRDVCRIDADGEFDGRFVDEKLAEY